MKKTTHALACTFGLIASLSSFQAFANQADHIQVSDSFTREMPPGAHVSASFMTLTNNSDSDIKLIKASSSVAKTVELHTHSNDNGMMKMRQVEFFEVPAQGQTHLKPSGNHIMLISPTTDIKAGQTVTLTLTFQDGSTKTVNTPVKSVMKMNHDNHQHHQH